MRWPHLLLCALLLVPSSAFAAGPVFTTGVIGVHGTMRGHDWARGMTGGSYKLAFEVGQRFRNEWSYNQSVLMSDDGIGTRTLGLTGFGYQLTFHLRPKGFSPYVGLGIEMGFAFLESQRHFDFWSDDDVGPYLHARALFGLRYQMRCGLGFRGEIARGTYGAFYAWQGNLGISYTF